jgi:hypothetical protein
VHPEGLRLLLVYYYAEPRLLQILQSTNTAAVAEKQQRQMSVSSIKAVELTHAQA